MTEDEAKSLSLVSLSDALGLGAASIAIVGAVERAVGRLYRPVAIRGENGALIEMRTKAIVETAKARAEAAAILVNAHTELTRIQALQMLETIEKMERQADTMADGLKRAAEMDDGNDQGREPKPEWMDLFLDMAERIDDREIRRIWAEIFAREVSQERRGMSLHALDSMRFMEARHARLFDAYARTFLVFGRCWRSGFDTTFGQSGSSLLGKSDAHNDFRALAEMGFVEILAGDTPKKGSPNVLNFHRFAVRITPLNQTLNLQEVRPTMRGEELMRVMLDIKGPAEDMSVGRFAKDPMLAYAILDAGRQSMVLRRWFEYLASETFRVEVGVFKSGQSFLNTDFQLTWEKGGLERSGDGRIGKSIEIPLEISHLLA